MIILLVFLLILLGVFVLLFMQIIPNDIFLNYKKLLITSYNEMVDLIQYRKTTCDDIKKFLTKYNKIFADPKFKKFSKAYPNRDRVMFLLSTKSLRLCGLGIKAPNFEIPFDIKPKQYAYEQEVREAMKNNYKMLPAIRVKYKVYMTDPRWINRNISNK